MSVIALPEPSDRSTIESGPGFDIGWLVPPLPARRPERDESAVEGSSELREDRLTLAVESRHLVVMRPGQEAVQRAATMIEVGTVLMVWRAAERELNEIREDSPEWPRVHAEIVSLRAAYHRLFEEGSQLATSD